MEKSALHISMLGTSFDIAADEDPEHLENLLKNYQTIVENNKRVLGINDPLKLAILTGFLLCDEIEKIHKEGASGEQLTLDLIARIDEALPGDGEDFPPGAGEM